jgi:hypothetical protein
MKQMRRWVLFILLLAFPLSLSAVEGDSTVFVHRVGLNFRPSVIMQTHDFFKGANMYSRPMVASASAHLQYSFMFPSGSRLGRLYPTA